jgi:hypothetical protein
MPIDLATTLLSQNGRLQYTHTDTSRPNQGNNHDHPGLTPLRNGPDEMLILAQPSRKDLLIPSGTECDW